MRRFTTAADSKRKRLVSGLLAAGFWLVVWQAVSLAVGQELLVPAPLQVAAVLGRMLGSAVFWKAAGFSLLRVAGGFLAAAAAGCAAAAATVRFQPLRALLSPLLRVIRAAPVASFIILALVWIRTDRLPAFIAFLMVTPVVWANVEKGIRETDSRLLEMASVFQMGRWRTLLRVRIPSVMPYFLTACTTGLGFAWKSAIAAEVICRPAASIGKQLQDAKTYLETPEVFAWTVVAVILSMVLERLLVAAAGRFGRRYNARA